MSPAAFRALAAAGSRPRAGPTDARVCSRCAARRCCPSPGARAPWCFTAPAPTTSRWPTAWPGAASELARAAALGACWIRFADSPQPGVDLTRLLADFQARFGALPPANEPQPAMSTTDDKRGISYRDAGVDIDAGDELVERIKPHVARTRRPEVLSGLGGFAGLCALPKGYKEPLLVSCTDGVGTKLKLAFLTGRHDTVGIDLVAMSVNDMVVSGAEPLFFLDYFAAGKLEVAVAEQVIAGIASGCEQAGCALVGGETAELPGLLPTGRIRPGRLLRRRGRTRGRGRRPHHRRGRRAAGAGVVRAFTRTATRWCARCCWNTPGWTWRRGHRAARAWTNRWPMPCCGRRASTSARCASCTPRGC